MKGYRFVVPIEVRFGDLDVMGHVNNATYLTYFETARLKYYGHLIASPALDEVDIILAEVTCTYKSPALYGEVLDVGIRTEQIGRKSFVLSYRVEEQQSHRLIATGRSVQVAFDYASGQTKPVSETFIRSAEDFEGRSFR